MGNYERVWQAAERILREGEHLSPTRTMPGPALTERVMAIDEVTIEPATVHQYIFKASRDPATHIESAGHARGYYYDAEFDVGIVDEAPPTLTPQERHLYVLVEYWLRNVKDVKSKDISQVRAGGKWGNPDLVGIKLQKDLGLLDLEIITAEVKLSDNNWRQEIFEAISHKRFANRSYYMFRVSEGAKMRLPKDMESYVERFGIGVVMFPVSDAELQRLQQAQPELLAELADKAVEICPAFYEFTPPRFQIEFLRRIGIEREHDLYAFGAPGE